MVKPFSGVLQPRNNLTRSGQNGVNPESRDIRRRSAPPRRLLVESKSPFSKPREPAVFERQISPKRSRRDSRSASTVEGSPVLLDNGSEEEPDVLTQTSVSKRKRRRTDLNMAGGKDQQQNWQSSQRPSERTGVDAMMDSSEYPTWRREGKLIDRMQAASSKNPPTPTDMYPEDLVATKKLDLPIANQPQRRQPGTAEASSRLDKGTKIKFPLKYCYADGIKMDIVELMAHVDGANRKLRFRKDGGDELTSNLNDVLTVIASDSSQGKKIRLQLRAPKLIWVDLETSESAAFDHLVAILESEKNVKLRRKKAEWLEAARSRAEMQDMTHNATLDAELAESGQRHRERARRSAVEINEPRRRLSDKLEPNRFNERPITTNSFSAALSSPQEQTPARLTRRVTRSSGGTRDVQNMAEEQTSREMRSGNHDSTDDTAALMAARHQDFGPKWKRPLVYPRDGKKRATVEYEDLLRLDDGEFLNDNIIGFYLRYLMTMIEDALPQEAKRIYWFNSFFFERLTGLPRARGSINYDAVKRWTRDVDLFTYDYVVVPVNENAHWYLVLICNLPQLFENETRGEPEDIKVPGSSPHHPIGIDESQELSQGRDGKSTLNTSNDVDTKEGIDTSMFRNSIPAESSDPVVEIPASPNDRDDAAPDGVVTVDTLDVPEPSELFAERKVLRDITGTVDPNSSARSAAAHRKKKRASIRQFDLLTPALITLDSLGLTHPQTTRAIKQYLVQEAQDKKGVASFEESSLQGINARGIPKQDNWCDCGPYLLAYMDKFTKNPSEFVGKLLQKQFDEELDWPNQLRPSQMRSNIKSLIVRLHKDQHSGARKSQAPALPLASDPINADEDRQHEAQERLVPIADAALRAQEQGDDIVKSSIEEMSAAGPTVNHFEVSRRTRVDAFPNIPSVDPTVIPDSQDVINHSPILGESLPGALPSSSPADQMAVDTVSSPPALEEQLRRAATAGELTDHILLDDEP